MKASPLTLLLKAHGLRDTGPRRFVLQALQDGRTPLSPAQIEEWVRSRGQTINTVTVYRILEQFLDIHLVHRHPCDGRYSLCQNHGAKGHHGFLHCTSCGSVEEFCSEKLQAMAAAAAEGHKFALQSLTSEVHGTCEPCTKVTQGAKH